MKINKRLRKAFTLVELVVVIAIIAILSTVSVVTYFGITNSAKKSVDDQTITQWNQLLLLEEELGNKSETPQEALDIILENGWDVAKLTPTYEGNEILWDQEENRFLILDKDTVTNSRVRNAYESSRKGEYWRFLKDYSEPKGYSVYITDPEFKVSETLTVTAGIDLSRVTEKVDVKYENVSKDQKVILNTNGGTLIVDSANVEVKHFGIASKSTVSSKSYEEKGTVVGDTLVNGGKYIATSSEAEAGTVLVSSKDVELNISASAKVGTVAGTTDEAQAAIKSNTNIPSDKKLDSDTAVVPTTDFAGGLGTENSPYLISNFDNWMNFKNSTKAYEGNYWSVLCDLDFENYKGEEKTYSLPKFIGHINFNNHVVKNLTTKNCINLYYGVYGGLFYYLEGNTTIENLNFYLSCLGSDYVVRPFVFVGACTEHSTNVIEHDPNVKEHNIFLKNVNVYGDVSFDDNNAAAYCYYIGHSVPTKVELDNCDNYVNITNTKMSGAFIGGVMSGDTEDVTLSFKNCDYYGKLTTTGTSAAMLISNNVFKKTKVELLNNSNKGQILCMNNSGKINLVSGGNNSEYLNSLAGTGKLVNYGVAVAQTVKTITIDENNYYNFNTVDNADRYEFIATAYTNSSNGGAFAIKYDIAKENLHKIEYKEFYTGDNAYIGKYTTNSYGFKIYDGKYVFKNDLMEDDSYIVRQPDIILVAYDAEGNIMQVSQF